jgi:TonB-linked SusC/RagA family outer membrane protein
MKKMNQGQVELPVHRWLLLSLCIFMFGFTSAFAGTKVKGVVTDKAGTPLIGATIKEKGGVNGTATDQNGAFTMTLDKSTNALIVSYVGYVTSEVLYKGEKELIIRLDEDSKLMKELVVVGYQTMRKSDITGSIASVKSDELNLSAPTIGQSLVGKVSGVQISQVSGAPYKSTKIRVRGTSSINASSDPLYVIDGYPSNGDIFINPEDVESIDVLKDAASAAIYGSRAAGGVILITTKRGKEGKTSVTYDFQFGVDQLARKVKLMNAKEFTELLVDAHNNTYKDLLISGGKVTQANWTDDYFKDNNDQRTTRLGTSSSSVKIPESLYDFTTGTIKDPEYDTDWQDELYRNALNLRHNISITGGKNGVRYALSGGYQNQQGIMLCTDMEKYNLRSNLDIDINKRLTVGANFAYTDTKSNEVGEGRFHGSPVMAALIYLPIFKAYNEDGTPAKYEMSSLSPTYAYQSDIENPIAYVQEVKNFRKTTRSNYNVYGQFKVLESLVAKLSFGTYNYTDNYEYYRPTSLTSGTYAPYSATAIAAAYARSRRLDERDYLTEFTLNYNQAFGNLNLSGVAGASTQSNSKDILDVTANGFTDDKVPYITGGGAEASNFTRNTGTQITTYAMASGFSRVNANYLNRYHITASFRGDGSSLFGPKNRWAYFPSVSGGWTASGEDFYKNIFSDNSELKLRASWGLSGNDGIGTYNYQQVMGKTGVVIGNNVMTAMYPGTFRDENLGWESTSQTNLGFDLSLFNRRLSVIANYYDSYTFNLLFEMSVTALSGSTSMLTNLPDSKINNRGFDIQVDGVVVSKKDFELKLSGNFSLNRNKVLDLGGASTIITNGAERSYKTHITMEGQPIGMFYGFKVAGMINEEDLENIAVDDQYYNSSTKSFPAGYQLKGPARSLASTTKFQLGDLYFVDTDGNGVVDDNDKTIIGNPHPDFIYAFNLAARYKDFDISASFNGVYGNDVLDGQNYYNLNMEGSGNQYKVVTERYRNAANPGNGEIYRASRGGTQSNSTRLSTFYLNDGSYFRLNNITIGYNWNTTKVTKNAISGVRFYLSSDNLFTLQTYRGYNPEVDYNDGANLTPGVDYGKYPLMRSFNAGVKVQF